MTKFCPRCVKEKPVGEFHLQRDRHKRQGYCKECAFLYLQKYSRARNDAGLQAKIEADGLRYATLGEQERPSGKVCIEPECAMAGQIQSPEHFNPSPISSDGLSHRCRHCMLLDRRDGRSAGKAKERSRVWYEKNREVLNAATKQWRKENPEECRKLHTRRRFRQYKATPEWYAAKLAEQSGGCAICGSTDPKSNGDTFHIDHDHRCCEKKCHACDQCRRGLLCSVCNVWLATLENTEWRIKAQVYLRQYDTQTITGE